MAEAFGIAAGVLTVIDLSVKVISKCKHLIETTKDAPKDLRQIFIEISSLKATLESLQFLSATDSDFSDTIQGLDDVEGAVQGCKDTVEELAKELDRLAISKSSQVTQGKRQMLKGSLKWCLKESKAQKLLESAVRHKSTISLALLGEVAQDVKVIKSNVGKLRQDLEDTKQREVCNWIERINPTRDHNNALKLRDDQTCQWILSLQQWKDWLAGTNRLIWIHGIPGAGKTILASYMIERIAAFGSKLQVTNACLYFYCSYRHGDNQATSFLRWIVSQLCRQFGCIPEEIIHLHQKNSELTLTQLKAALVTLLSKVGIVYLVLDAIDECNATSDVRAVDAPGMRMELLQLLESLVTSPEYAKIRIVATSRDYIDIKETMRPLSVPVSMSNELVDKDIRIYVSNQLQTSPKLRRWPQALLSEIEDALVQGAKGMFRWASCQIYILERKRTESDIRKALRELPVTLDETYTRILGDIPREDWIRARTALLWICVHESLPFQMGIPENCLVSAVFSPAPTETHLYSITTLREICGCLIRTSNFKCNYKTWNVGDDTLKQKNVSFETVSLAHYTVKEFLYSQRIENTNISYFYSSEEGSIRTVLRTSLEICSTLDLWKKPDPFFLDLPNYCREIGRLAPRFLKHILLDDDYLFKLQIQFLDNPCIPPGIVGLKHVVYTPIPFSSCYRWKATSGLLASRQSLIVLRLFDEGAAEMCTKFLQNLDLQPIFDAPLEVVDDISGGLHSVCLLQAMQQMYDDDGDKEIYESLLQLCKQKLDSDAWLGVIEQVPQELLASL